MNTFLAISVFREEAHVEDPPIASSSSLEMPKLNAKKGILVDPFEAQNLQPPLEMPAPAHRKLVDPFDAPAGQSPEATAPLLSESDADPFAELAKRKVSMPSMAKPPAQVEPLAELAHSQQLKATTTQVASIQHAETTPVPMADLVKETPKPLVKSVLNHSLKEVRQAVSNETKTSKTLMTSKLSKTLTTSKLVSANFSTSNSLSANMSSRLSQHPGVVAASNTSSEVPRVAVAKQEVSPAKALRGHGAAVPQAAKARGTGEGLGGCKISSWLEVGYAPPSRAPRTLASFWGAAAPPAAAPPLVLVQRHRGIDFTQSTGEAEEEEISISAMAL
eukprot:Skav207540  [mRNA]  locus=scaffold756:246825:248719:- [translate_table: standard]